MKTIAELRRLHEKATTTGLTNIDEVTDGFDALIEAMPSLLTRAELLEEALDKIRLADIARLTKERDEARAENMCDVCAGEGKPINGRDCICAGSGKMSVAAQHLRRLCVEARAEVERLRAMLMRGFESPPREMREEYAKAARALLWPEPTEGE